MKEIEIIINGDKLERVKRILSAFSKNGIFVSQGFGYGHQQGYHQVYTRDDNRGVNMLPKVSVRTVVANRRGGRCGSVAESPTVLSCKC